VKDVLFKKLVEPKVGSDLLVVASDNLVTLQQFSNGGLIGVDPDAVTELCATLLSAAKAAKQAREKKISPIAGQEIPQLKTPVPSDAGIQKESHEQNP
jgi:hypothetical protein